MVLFSPLYHPAKEQNKIMKNTFISSTTIVFSILLELKHKFKKKKKFKWSKIYIIYYLSHLADLPDSTLSGLISLTFVILLSSLIADLLQFTCNDSCCAALLVLFLSASGLVILVTED